MNSITFSPRFAPSFCSLSQPLSDAIYMGFGSCNYNPMTSLLKSKSRRHLPTFKRSALAVTLPTVKVDDEQLKLVKTVNNGILVPLYRCVFSDHLSPLQAYRCLVKEGDDQDLPSFLFETVEQGIGETIMGRYSIVGAHPMMEIVAKENVVTITDYDKGTKTEEFVENPMEIPRKLMEEWSPQLIDELPDAFCVRYIEKKKLPFSNAPIDDRNLPDISLALYDEVIVFDHIEKKIFVILWVRLDHYSSIEEAYKDGMNKLEGLVSKVHNIDPPRLSAGSVNLHSPSISPATSMKSNMTPEEYMEAVVQAKEHIAAGDIFQARGCILVASSLEILTRVKKRKVISRPLAGTIRRGKTEMEDQMLEKQLLDDEKECAEHIMLVDLGRNDVGKVSKAGTVKVEKLMNVERYSHVMHISSTVKSMEILHQLEVTRRGPYSGGFGYVSFLGDMDIAIAKRTIVFPTAPNCKETGNENKRKEWVAHFQAGSGIVADSEPTREKKECENKVFGLARAIELAETTFGNNSTK